jgi:hypothetical protein
MVVRLPWVAITARVTIPRMFSQVAPPIELRRLRSGRRTILSVSISFARPHGHRAKPYRPVSMRSAPTLMPPLRKTCDRPGRESVDVYAITPYPTFFRFCGTRRSMAANWPPAIGMETQSIILSSAMAPTGQPGPHSCTQMETASRVYCRSRWAART